MSYEFMGYDTFRHAGMLKKEGNIMYMFYDNKGKIRLANPNLGLYVVQSFLIEIAVTRVNQRAPQRVASER